MTNRDLILALINYLLERNANTSSQTNIESPSMQPRSHMHDVFKSSNTYPQNDNLWAELGVDSAEHFGKENLKNILESGTDASPSPHSQENKLSNQEVTPTLKNDIPKIVSNTKPSNSELEKLNNQPKAFDDFDFDF